MPHNSSVIDNDSYSSDASGFDPEALLSPSAGGRIDASAARQPDPADELDNGDSQPDDSSDDPYVAPHTPIASPAPASDSPSSTHRLRREADKAKSLMSDSRTLLFVGLVLVVAAIYMLIVSVSYFRTLGHDQSAVLNGELAPELITNSGGPLGAWLSNLLIHDWLGVGSFILIIYIGLCGLMLLNVFSMDFWKLTLRCLACAVAVSIIGGFVTVNLASPVYWGGLHGHLLNERLMLFTGVWGALAVSVIMAGLVCVLFYRPLGYFFSLMGQGIAAFKARRERRRIEREARDEAEAKEREAEETRRAEIQAIEDERRRAEASAARDAALARAEAERAEAERARAEAEAARIEALRLESERRSLASSMQPAQPVYAPETAPETAPESQAPASSPAVEAASVPPAPSEAASEAVPEEKDEPLPPAYTPASPTSPENKRDEAREEARPLFTDDAFDTPAPAEKMAEPPVAPAAQSVTKPEIESPSEEVIEEQSESARPLFADAISDEPAPVPASSAEAAAYPPLETSSESDTDDDPDDNSEDSSLFDADPEEEVAPAYGSIDSLYDPRADLPRFTFPSIDLLPEADQDVHGYDSEVLRQNMERITKTLADYNINIQSIEATVGPTVILYEIVPAEGVRVARVKSLEDDLALKLAAIGVRIIAPMPGRGTIGIEVPREDPQIVSMRSVVDSPEFADAKMELPMVLGRTVSNQVFVKDLAKMPHLLVAGATGMGKSVGLNAIITSLLYKKHPAELKFVLIDPKQVEFNIYAKLEQHYLAKLPDEEEPVIVDPQKAIATLNSLCVEMENRYALLKKADMRNIKEYNSLFIHRKLSPDHGHKFLPYIVVIVDEFADLIMMAGRDIETPIARIAQKARAVGIHMIIATQHPSTNVITGLIKANFPGRIAFRVFQMVDSRTILDRPGANQLIGRGDLLFSNNGKIDRVQCAFIDTPEVIEICRHISSQTGYHMAYELPEYAEEGSDQGGASSGKMANIGDRDPLFEECARHVVNANLASTSALQRHYSIGFNRAGKIMDQMEAVGIVGPATGGKPRQVLTDPIGLEAILASI